MFQINKTLISEELISKYFKCNLSACQGACCVEGEAGAPLEENEIKMLEDDFNAIRPFLSTKGLKAIEDQGKHVNRKSGELEPYKDKVVLKMFISRKNKLKTYFVIYILSVSRTIQSLVL